MKRQTALLITLLIALTPILPTLAAAATAWCGGFEIRRRLMEAVSEFQILKPH